MNSKIGTFFVRLLAVLTFTNPLIVFSAELRQSCINYYLTPPQDGPHLFFDWEGSDNTKPPDTFTMMSQNFKNLGLFQEFHHQTIIENGEKKDIVIPKTIEKSKEEKERLAYRIRTQNPDFIIGTEIKDQESAEAYVKSYLNDQYNVILIEGNDIRGIDICFFIKKTLPLDIEVISHKNVKENPTDDTPLFSRDLPVFLLRNHNAKKLSPPFMAIAGVHYKSQRVYEGKANNSFEKRQAQVQMTSSILANLQLQYPGLGIIIAGDFNNDVRNSAEFKSIFDSGFEDSLNLVPNSIPKEERYTEYSYNRDANPPVMQAEQLDMIALNPILKKLLKGATIQRDINSKGEISAFPKTPADVNQRGSDHDAIVIEIENPGFIE